MAANFDPDSFTRNFLLTKSYHRDLYPAIDPSNPELDASGKVVIITGAGGGLGNVGLLSTIPVLPFNSIFYRMPD